MILTAGSWLSIVGSFYFVIQKKRFDIFCLHNTMLDAARRSRR